VPGKLEIPFRFYAGETGSEFLTTLRDKKTILAKRCEACNINFMPPRSLCNFCHQKTGEWVEVGPAGIITSFTVVRYWEPYLPMKPPFVMAMIKLDGADTPLTHLVSEVDPDDVRVGMRVEPVWAEERKANITDIAYFRPPVSTPAAAGPEKTAIKTKPKKAAKKTTKKKTAKKAAKKKTTKKKTAKKTAKKTTKKKTTAKKTAKKATKKAAKKKAVKKTTKKKTTAKKATKKKTAKKSTAKKTAKKTTGKKTTKKKTAQKGVKKTAGKKTTAKKTAKKTTKKATKKKTSRRK